MNLTPINERIAYYQESAKDLENINPQVSIFYSEFADDLEKMKAELVENDTQRREKMDEVKQVGLF